MYKLRQTNELDNDVLKGHLTSSYPLYSRERTIITSEICNYFFYDLSLIISISTGHIPTQQEII